VVGGPYKVTYLLMPNEIPKDARLALEQADSFELFSLSPDRPEKPLKDGFQGWKILGKTSVKDKEVRKKLVTAFEQGIEQMDGLPAACFNPRHGLRVTRKGKTVDYVVCFECLQVAVCDGEDHKAPLRINASPEPLFDRILRDAGVPLATKAKQ
jgi:hypothetical protein